MDSKQLYSDLLRAYSDENLNKITAQIIEMYKSGFHSGIRDIQEILSSYFSFKDKRIHRCYSSLIKIYHPDRGTAYRNEIETLFKNNDHEGLERMSHILHIEKYDEIAVSATDVDFDIDYEPQYVWDQEEGFSEENPEDMGASFRDKQYEEYPPLYNDFLSALRRKVYGTLNIEFTQEHLADLEEIEMADYEIEILDGLEMCQNLTYLDLSRNCITNIAELSNLFLLEEVILAENEISYIDALSCMNSLRILDLANNSINDITPILHLGKLEFVDLSDNPVPLQQIEELRRKKIAVIF